MKKPSLYIIIFISLAITACENPMIKNLLDPKTIYFDSNGGSYVPSQTIYKNERIAQPQDPVMDGYLFNGWWWSTYYDGFLEKWDFNNIPEGDMTLYALWYTEETQLPIQPNLTPVAEDFYFEGNWSEGTLSKDGWKVDYDSNYKAVTVIAKPGKSGGKITVYYQQLLNDTTYGNKTSTPPSAPGTYKVTFDVEAADGWNAAYGFFAEMLIIQAPIMTSAENLKNFLYSLDTNTPPANPYIIPMNIIEGTDFNEIANAISYSGRYVSLDLSGSTIETIPDNAFYYSVGSVSYACDRLTGIIIPDSVKTIGNDAFRGCSSLTGVTIGMNVESIGNNAFRGCTSLTSVNIPNKVTKIENEVFAYCGSLTSITIPSSVNEINDEAFANCTNLTRVTFEGTINSTIFSQNAFPGNLRTVFYSSNNQSGTPGTYTRANGSNQWTKSQ